LVVPFFNEGEGIEAFRQAMTQLAADIAECEFEIVCVDDGSSDDTLAQLSAIASQDQRYRVIEFSRNFGKEAALTAGIDFATGDAVIPFDSDLQHPVELIPVMIEEWRQGAEVVLAYRSDRSNDSFAKRKTAELFYQAHNWISRVRIPPNVGDFRLMDRAVVEALKRLPERQRFMKGLFAWVGFRTVMVDYVANDRAFGRTKFSGWKLWNFALEGITSFSTVPLRIWSYLGAVGMLLTVLYALYTTVKTLLFGVDVPGYASLMVAIVFFGCVQLIGIGILGEYVGRMYMETKGRPIYIVRKTYGSGPHDQP